MYRFVIFICLLLSSSVLYCQNLSEIKHIEVVSEIKDSMILLNKIDVDKINKTYFEKNKLDSLNMYNVERICLLENKVSVQDSIINNQSLLLKNELSINTYLRQNIQDNSTQYEKWLRKERARKVGWQITTGAAVIGIIVVLIVQ